MKEQLIDFYLGYVNGFITVAGMADYYGYTVDEMKIILNAGKELYEKSLNSKQ